MDVTNMIHFPFAEFLSGLRSAVVLKRRWKTKKKRSSFKNVESASIKYVKQINK